MNAGIGGATVGMINSFDKTSGALLVVALVAMFNCLVRSDYNLIVALVCYYFWRANDYKSDRIGFVIKVLLIIVQIFDVIWILVIWNSWTGNYASPVWRSLKFWHIFVIITSMVNWVFKFVALAFVFMESKPNPNTYAPMH